MKKNLYPLFLLSLLALAACRKDFLDTRPAKSLLVPATLADLRALLDNNQVFNTSPALTATGDGDLYTTDAGYQSFILGQERGSYTWAADLLGTEPTADWNAPYEQVFYTNVVLEGLAKLPPSGAEYAAVKGTAHFFRAFAYFNLAQTFAAPYQAGGANTAPGIPLKKTSDVAERPGRGTLAETYAQILSDLGQARALLPLSVAYKSRPGRAAAYALYARLYLAARDYARAGLYADSCLQLQNALLDYNTLDPALPRPFPRALPNGNEEVLFYAVSLGYTYQASFSAIYVDSLLYRSYAENDLRKTLFFREPLPGAMKFRGNYAGILSLFSGLATDEQVLIRAECAARAGRTAAAMADLNRLLEKRWRTGTFVAYAAGDAAAALRLVLAERRKELLLRNLRWSDLRRLNQEAGHEITLRRFIAGQAYTLEPNSKRYILPIPEQELRLNPNIVQNER